MKKKSIMIMTAFFMAMLWSFVLQTDVVYAVKTYDNVFKIKGTDGKWTKENVKLTVQYLGHDHFRDTKNKKYSYSINGGSYKGGESVTISSTGVTKVKFKLRGEYQVNFMGGWNDFDSYEEVTVKIDKNAPVLKFSGGVLGQWINSNQVVTASASDPESGIAYFESDGRKTISKEGVNSVSFSAKNYAGYTSTIKGKVLIDKTAPTIKIDNPLADGKWANKPVTVSATVKDNLSGIDKCQYDIGGGWKNGSQVTISNEGETIVRFRVVDSAGNSTEGSTRVCIDKTEPTMKIYNPSSSWVNADSVTVEASAEDDLSGINKQKWYYNIGEGWKSGNIARIFGEGTTIVKFKVTDNAGNITEKYTKVFIDRTKPVISFDSIPDWNSQVSVTGHVYDQLHLSGLNSSTFQYGIDNGMLEPWPLTEESADKYSFIIPVYKEGVSVLYIKVSDKVGNNFKLSTKVNIDLTKPVIHNITLTETGFDGKVIEEGKYSSTQSVCASVYATDCYCTSILNPKEDNIVYKYQVSNAQNAYNKSNYKDIRGAQFEIEGFIDGYNYLYVLAVDAAGNETEKRVKVMVDSAAPNPPYIESYTHPYAYTVRDAVKGKTAVFELTHGISGISGFSNFVYSLEKGSEVLIDNEETTGKLIEFPNLEDNAEGEFYHLKVWSVSGSGRKGDECSLYTFRVDSSPPRYLTISSPTHVSESVYYADSQALLEWNKPLDFTGVKSYFYKFSKDPVGEDDRQGWTAADEQSVVVDLREIAGDNLKTAKVYAAVWAQDFAGNVQFDTRKFMYDLVRPELCKIGEEYVTIQKDQEKGEMIFSWATPTDNIEISRIFIKLAQYGKESEENFIMVGKQADSYTYKDVLADTDYIFTMKVFDTAGNCKMYSKAMALNYEITRDIAIPFSNILGGYKVEGDTYLDTSKNTAQLIVPYGMDLKVDGGVIRTIELINTVFDGDTLISGHSDISYVINSGDFSFTGSGITISEDEGLMLNEVEYRLPGTNNSITLNNVRISGAPSFVVLKSDIAQLPEFFYSEPQSSAPNNIGFTVKGGVSLENGNILFHGPVMDSTDISCKTRMGEGCENKLYFSSIKATSKGIVKLGLFDQSFVLDMKGNSYEVNMENALLNFEGIVVKEMDFSGIESLNFTLSGVLIPIEGIPFSLEGFGFTQNTFGPDDLKLTMNGLKIIDGSLVIEADLTTGNGSSYSINNVEFTGGVLDKKGIEEQSYVSVGFTEEFYSNLSKASLKLSEFNVDYNEEEVNARASVEQINGLTIWDYGILSGDLIITKNKGEESQFAFEGSVKLEGEIPEGMKEVLIPVTSCTFGENAKVSQFQASVALEDRSMFSGSTSIIGGTINITYNEETGPSISCTGNLFLPWMLEKLLGDTGVAIEKLNIASQGKIEEFSASRSLPDSTPYKGGSIFNDCYVVGSLDENGKIIFRMSGDLEFTEDFPGGIADTGIYIEEMIFNDMGRIELLNSNPQKIFDAGFIRGSEMELSDIIIEANEDGTGINYIVSGQLRLAEIKDIKGLTQFDGMLFDVERLVISDEGYVADIRAGGSIDGTINFIGNTVIENPSVYIIDALSEYEQFNTRIGGKIIIPIQSGEDINYIPPIELNIDRMLLDEEGNPYLVDASIESSGIRPFIGKSYLKDPKISLSYSEGEILTSFQGKVILLGVINEESDLELDINNLVINQNGELKVLDVSGTIPDDVKTAGDFLLRQGTIRFVKEGNKTPIVEISGKILLPEMEFESFSRMEINLTKLCFDLKGNLLAISAQQQIGSGFKIFDDIKLESGAVGIQKESPEDPIVINVSGTMVLPESAPGALSGAKVALTALSFDQNGKILDFGASLDLGPNEKAFIGSSKIRNGFLSIGKPDSNSATEIEIKGTIILPEDAPGAVSGAEVTINKFVMDTDMSIKELDITALEFLDERRLVGGLNSKNIRMSILKSQGSQFKIILEGDIILKDGFPDGLKNKVFAINEFIVDSSGKIEKLSINAQQLDVNLYNVIGLKNGSITVENGSGWNELLFKVCGDLILPKAMPGDLSSRTIHIKSFVISTKDGVVDFKADPVGSVTFNLWGGIKAVVNGLDIHSDSISCSGYVQLPSNYPQGIKNLRVNVNRLELGYNGSVKDFDADVEHIDMKLAGFSAEGWNMKIGKDGAKFSRCEIQMPANLSNKKIKIINAGFDTKGNFTGRFETPDIVFDIAGCTLTLKSAHLNFSKNEITFSQARLRMASELGGQTVTLNGVKVRPDGIRFTGGAFNLPSFKISQGVGFRGAKVNFRIEGNEFILEGTSGIMMKNLGSFKGTISIADKSSSNPIGLRRAEFEFRIGGLGVPIGTTGLYLNKIRGGIAFGYPYEVPSQVRGMFSNNMRIKMGVSMQDQSYGNLVRGNVDLWLDVEDCSMAFKGNVTVLNGLAKGEMITAISKKGFYGMVRTEMLFARGTVEINVFDHRGKTCVSGSGKLDIGVKKGAVYKKTIKIWKWKKKIRVPGKDVWVGSAGAAFGLFKNGKKGVKGYVDFPIVGNVGIFVSSSSVKIGNVSSYKLYKPSWASAYGVRSYAFAGNYSFLPPQSNAFSYNFLVPSKDGVQADAERVVFCLAGIDDPNSVVLISPEGKRYGISSPKVVASFEDWGILAAIIEPETGEWSLEISGFESEEEFDVDVLGVLRVPEISMGTVEYKNEKRESAIITGTISNVDKDTQVGIYLSDSADTYYGEPAAIASVDADGNFRGEIDLKLFDNGKYYVFAAVEGQEDNPDVYVKFDEVVEVNLTSVKLKPVVNLIVADNEGGDVEIVFEDMNGERTHGFNLYVEDIATGAEEVFDLGYITNTYLPGCYDGEVLNIAVAPYDINMVEGERSHPVTVQIGGIKEFVNIFNLEKEEISVQAVRGEVMEKDIKLINPSPERTGTALDYVDVSVVQAVYDSKGESVIDSVYGIKVDFESCYDITKGEASINFKVLAEEDLAPGEYTVKAAVENMGNRDIRQDMTIRVTVIKPDFKVSDVYPECIDLSEDRTIEITGSNFSEDTKVYLSDKELNIVERYEDMLIAEIPENPGYGIKKLKITGDNNQLFETEVEILEPFYTVTCDRDVLYTTPGSIVNTGLLIKGENGFNQGVKLSVSDLPEGWEASFDKQISLPGEMTVMTLKIPKDFESGDYNVKVTSDENHEISIVVHVREGNFHPVITGYSRNWGTPGDAIKIFGGFFKENAKVLIGDNEVTVLSVTEDTIEVLIGDNTNSGEVQVQCGDLICRGSVFNVISPLSLIVIQGEPDGDNSYYITRPQMEIEYHGYGEVLYRINDGDFTPCKGRFNVDEGVNRIEANTYDETGNKVYSKEWTVRFDKTPPVTSIEEDSLRVDIEKGIHINSSDNVSGIREMKYRIKSENIGWTNWNTYEKQVMPIQKGWNNIEYYGIDNAGNLEKVKLVSVRALERLELGTDKYIEASTSYDPSMGAEKANDGNSSTRWASECSDSQWIMLDFGSSYEVDGVKLNWDKAYGKAYKIQVSGDRILWSDVYSTTQGDGGVDEISFKPVVARYARVYCVESVTQSGCSLYDFNVYGFLIQDQKTQVLNVVRNPIINSLHPYFKVVNTGTDAIELYTMKIRYYYTVDSEKPQKFTCDWSPIGKDNVTGEIVKMTVNKANADHYVEIGFTKEAGDLKPGQDIEIKCRVNKDDWTNYDQTNDYSFDGRSVNYTDSERITVSIFGYPVQGIEP